MSSNSLIWDHPSINNINKVQGGHAKFDNWIMIWGKGEGGTEKIMDNDFITVTVLRKKIHFPSTASLPTS